VRRTLRTILAEYGTVALVVYLTIFSLVLAGFAVAFWLGWKPASVAGGAGTLTAAYLATKLTQPVRIVATIALTPIVARAYERVRGQREVRSEK
jgi:hypothetical protein